MTERTDIELSELIKASDPLAFRMLFERYSDALFHFLYSKTCSVDTAREIVQETFIRLWQTRERLDAHKTLKPYLFRIANNLLTDLYRKNKVRSIFQKDQQIETGIAFPNDLELETQINLAIQQLPENCRTVFILHHINKYTFNEISEMCEISRKTVENRLKKAIFLLQKLLMLL